MKKAVLTMPDATHLHTALRTIRHIAGAEMALVLPAQAQSLAEVVGLAQVLDWARAAGKDVTLIGGTPEMRAAAVAEGWRVSTSLEEWEAWLAATPHLASPAVPPTTPDASAAPLPDMLRPVDALAHVEQHEEAIIALIWQTGKLADVPGAFYGA